MTRLLLASCVLVVAVAPLRAYGAGTAALSVTPDSGGPGSVVTVSGNGFCSRPGCGVVSLTIAGRRFAPEQTPSSSGTFRVRTQVSGGYASGSLEIQATQTLDDGNELTASTQFTYAPSKGEAAEREAETRDQVTHLVNPSAPVATPKGVPFASFAAAASTTAAPPATATTHITDPTASAEQPRSSWAWAMWAVAGAVAAVAVTSVLWRRRGGAHSMRRTS